MAVIEPRRKSPNSKNSVKMAERCCSRLARDSGKGYLLILTYHYVRICDTKKEISPIPPFMSRTQGNRSACKRRRSVVHVTHSKRLVSIRSPRRLLRGILRGEFMHRRYSFRNALIELNCAAMQAPTDPELMEALAGAPEIESIQVLKSALDQMRHFLWFYMQVVTSDSEMGEKFRQTLRQEAPVQPAELEQQFQNATDAIMLRYLADRS